MREVFAINGQFTEESKKEIVDFVNNSNHLPSEKVSQVFDDIRETADYGRLSYVKQVSDFLEKLGQTENGKYMGITADMNGGFKSRLERGDYKREIFSYDGKFTKQSEKDMFDTLNNFSSFSPEKQNQIMQDTQATITFGSIAYLEKMEGFLKSSEGLQGNAEALKISKALQAAIPLRIGVKKRNKAQIDNMANSLACTIRKQTCGR